jgi:opacity protein-like surface antigen
MKKIAAMVMLVSAASFTQAKDIEFTDVITQEDFTEFTKEFGTALLFNPMATAEPLGITGFDVSLETVFTDISDDKAFWKKLVDDNDPYSYLPVPRLHVQKGLPFNIDVGAMFTAVPDSNIKLWGLEAKYAIFEGSMLTPALSVRASYSQLQGVDDIDADTLSLDILVSKGFLMFTPYAGASFTKLNASENSELVTLDDVSETGYRALAGVQFSPFPLLIINGEISFGEVTQYGLKIGVRF